MLSPMSEKYILGREEHILIHQVDEGILLAQRVLFRVSPQAWIAGCWDIALSSGN